MTDMVAQQVNPLAVVLSDPERLKDLDIEKVERLFALNRQMEADARRERFHERFNAVQAEMIPVLKLGDNPQTRSKFAKAEHVYRMLDPIITKHGFSRSMSNESSDLADHIRFVLLLRNQGHEERHYWDAPIDDTGPKGAPTKTRLHGQASSATFIERQLTCKVFAVQTTEDTDGNAAGGEPVETITPEQAADYNAMLDEMPEGPSRRAKAFISERYGSIEAIPADAYEALVRKAQRSAS